MKYIVKAIGLLLLISVKLSAQGPAETIPEFNFFKLDESSFTNKNLEAGKELAVTLMAYWFRPRISHGI